MWGGISLSFWYDFPNDQWFEHFFMHVLIFHSYIFFRATSIEALCPFLNWILFFFCWWLGVLYILWLLISSQVYANMFSYSVGYFFILIIPSECKKLKKNSWSPIYLFFLVLPMPLISYSKIFFPKSNVLKHLP